MALLMAVPLLAASGSLIDSGYPPMRYQHDATAAAVRFSSDQDYIDRVCGKSPKGFVTLACTLQDKRQEVLPNPCAEEFAGQSFARTACHELGHLNGWPGNHPRP